MDVFAEVTAVVDRLRAHLGESLQSHDAPAVIAALGEDALITVMRDLAGATRIFESLRTTAAGVVASQSTREHGHSGFAQKRGHRTPVTLVQEITGSTRGEASKQVRAGTALLEATIGTTPSGVAPGGVAPGGVAPGGVDAAPGGVDAAPGAPAATPVAAPRPWHWPADEALLGGRVSTAVHDAIVQGLGAPVEGGDEAWMLAAQRLVDEASARTVEELAKSARTIRDMLDPEGAGRRFDERFERRALRTWRDEYGQLRASITFDDDGGAWVTAILDAALRPRRNGPRFVDSEEAARAAELAADPRSNDQLAYDLLIDTLRAGALADTAQVFGTRQAGVRVVVTAEALAGTGVDPSGELGSAGIGLVEDGGTAIPAWLAAQRACDVGTDEFTVDAAGNPLFVGRSARLFTPKQKAALAIRDGGCRWPSCDRPASYCEAHHCVHWARDGLTNVDVGILLCRFHHMQLHHGGWFITRAGDDFLLGNADGRDPVPMPPRGHLQYFFGGIDPPREDFAPPPRPDPRHPVVE
ncbi:HNH endonuclease signature motif containing protein [Microbacterium hominis]|uniref:DUF222 domain-containing protein n=1 Tax=Microbacterium hominis TaxID=162426 RepID=A0A7D4PW31_9MICO|nr:HNH endonuclease signature motif containing protein [Microbacterium hominis]QKJ20254.1 DUF222 domain-containing protein [Microbacterium hominis]